MSTFVSEVVMEWPVTSGSEIRSWKQFEPSSLLVREYTAALMRVTLGGFWGFTGRMGLEYLGQSPEVSEGELTTEVSWQRVISWIRAVMVAGKRCCSIPSQSRDCSGWASDILVQCYKWVHCTTWPEIRFWRGFGQWLQLMHCANLLLQIRVCLELSSTSLELNWNWV